ncbi:hypothetical protein ACQCX2_07620 [Propionibacteriaceae bacterium Y1700]|uniref:hypothetical protein n=1 Tax=Microlunatus sp. Y1700 TaxID=3418487 RepID=UPI003DA6DB06
MTTLTTSDIAHLEQCSTETVRKAILSGALRARVLNSATRRSPYRITEAAYQQWRANRKVQP